MKTIKLLEQRADPYVYRHTNGMYYFTASVPAFDLIELRWVVYDENDQPVFQDK